MRYYPYELTHINKLNKGKQMPNYLVQLTEAGGPLGCRVVPADGYIIEDSGAVTFIEDEHEVISFSMYEAVIEVNKIAEIEAATAAFFAE